MHSYVPRYRIQLVCDAAAPPLAEMPKLRNSLMLVDYLRPGFAGLDREHFVTVAVDGKNRPIAVETVSIGQMNAALVHPREVFKALILHNAAAFMAAHNHPSGDRQPSPQDDALTKRLAAAGEVLGIQLLDHVIVTETDYYSYAEAERL